MLDVRLVDALSLRHLLQCMKCDFTHNAMIRNVLKIPTSGSCVKDHDSPAALSLSVNAAGGVMI